MKDETIEYIKQSLAMNKFYDADRAKCCLNLSQCDEVLSLQSQHLKLREASEWIITKYDKGVFDKTDLEALRAGLT